MKQVITALQAGRAIAAIAVVVEHAGVATDRRVDPLPSRVMEFLHQGALGVDFFFVLSGFIIMHAHMNDPRGLAAALAYARKRALRIYTPYLPIALALITLYVVAPGVAAGKEWGLWTSLTLIAGEAPPAPVLGVAWTLIHEVLFYAIFAVSYFTRWFVAVVVLWVSLMMGASLFRDVIPYEAMPSLTHGTLQTLLAPINIEFVAGMVAAHAVRVLSPRWAPLFLMGGALGLVTYFGVLGGDASRVWFGLTVAVLLVGIVQLELTGSLTVPGWLVFLGNASYAIYLAHGPVTSAFTQAMARTPVLAPWYGSLVLGTLLGVAGGILYYLIIERPALRYFNNRRGAKRSGSPQLSGAVARP